MSASGRKGTYREPPREPPPSRPKRPMARRVEAQPATRGRPTPRRRPSSRPSARRPAPALGQRAATLVAALIGALTAIARVRIRLSERALHTAIAIGALALGTVLRLFDAGGKSLWFDEIVTLGVPDQPWSNLLHAAEIPGTNTPPLFPVLYKLWMASGSDDTWLRTGTALFGAGVVALAWLTGRRLFGPQVGMLAAVLCAVSAYQIDYSQYVRMYMLLALTGVASLYLLARAVAGGHRRWWMLWSVSAAACLYTFYYAGFLLAGEGIWLIWLCYRRPALRRAIGWSLALAVALYLPWVPAMVHHIAYGGTRAWMSRPTLFSLRYMMDQFFFMHSSQTAADIGFYVVLALGALGVLLPGDREARALLGVAACCGILLPYLASLVVQPFFDPRYLVYGDVVLTLFVARGLARGVMLACTPYGPRALGRALAGTALGIVLLGFSSLPNLYADVGPARGDIRAAIAALLPQTRPGDVIVYRDPFLFLPAVWYAHQMGGLGHVTATPLYEWMPSTWVAHAPLHQLALDREATIAAHWLPRAGGRVWMGTFADADRLRGRHAATWFHPPKRHWRLSRVERFRGLIFRLYVRR